MGFASGLKNWNSISSNIIKANQGAESLKLRAEELAPKTAQHKADLASGRYRHKAEMAIASEEQKLKTGELLNKDKELNLNEKRRVIEQNRKNEERRRALEDEQIELARQAESLNKPTDFDALKRIREQMTRNSYSLSRIPLSASMPGVSKVPTTTTGKATGTRTSSASALARRSQNLSATVTDGVDGKLKNLGEEYRAQAQLQQAVWQQKTATYAARDPQYRERMEQLSQTIEGAKRNLTDGGLTAEQQSVQRDILTTAQMERADGEVVANIFMEAEAAGIDPAIIVGWPGIIKKVQYENLLHYDKDGRPLVDKATGLPLHRSGIDRTATMAGVKMLIERYKQDKLDVTRETTAARGPTVTSETQTGNPGDNIVVSGTPSGSNPIQQAAQLQGQGGQAPRQIIQVPRDLTTVRTTSESPVEKFTTREFAAKVLNAAAGADLESFKNFLDEGMGQDREVGIERGAVIRQFGPDARVDHATTPLPGPIGPDSAALQDNPTMLLPGGLNAEPEPIDQGEPIVPMPPAGQVPALRVGSRSLTTRSDVLRGMPKPKLDERLAELNDYFNRAAPHLRPGMDYPPEYLGAVKEMEQIKKELKRRKK